MQVVGHHHQAQFGIFIRFRTNKVVAINHTNWIVESLRKSFQLVQIRNGIDTTPTDRIVISRDTSHHDDSRIGCISQGGHEFGNHEKVTQKIDLHRLLMIVDRPLGVRKTRLVDTRVA